MTRWMAAVAVVLVAAGCGRKAAPPRTADPAVPVQVAPAEAGGANAAIVTGGRVVGARETLVAWKIAGRVLRMRVKPGDRVRAGQPLADLDPVDARAAAAQADAAYDNAARAAAHAESLAASGALAGARVSDAQAGARAARAVRDQAHDALTRTTLTAPYAGVIGTTWAQEGELLAAGAPVASVVDDARLLARTAVTDADAGRVHSGDAATVRVASGAALDARVDAVGGAPDPATGLYRVDLALPAHAGLRPGMVVDATLEPRGDGRTVALVPPDAVLRRGGRDIVYLARAGHAVERVVTVGDVRGARVALLAGVAPGDSVVVVGQQYVRDGGALRVTAR